MPHAALTLTLKDRHHLPKHAWILNTVRLHLCKEWKWHKMRRGGPKCIKTMTQYASQTRGGRERRMIANIRTDVVAWRFFSTVISHNSIPVIRLCCSRKRWFHMHAHCWQLWQYKVTSSKYNSELYDLIASVFTVCPAPTGTEYINSISLAHPEYQHHRLDFTLPCLPECGPLNNIYTVCAYRKMMMPSSRGAADISFSCVVV